MLTEKFIQFLKSNLTNLVDKLDELEKKANKNEIGFDDLLFQLFTNPAQRRMYEQLFEDYEQKNTSKDAYDKKSPFEKFDYFYEKYEKQFDEQQKDTNRSYQDFKQQQQNKQQQGSANFTTSAKEARYYQVLEVKQGATFDEIRDAYKKSMKKYHPDRFHGDAEKQKTAEQLSKEINEAYSYFEKKFGK